MSLVHIAVVIPAFNAAAWLPACLASLRAQTEADWSAIVVDDGSADDLAAVVAAEADSRICLVRQPNAGVSAARNHGIRVALGRTGKWRAEAFLFLDSDDWLSTDALARLRDALQAAPWAVAAAGGHAFVQPCGRCRRIAPPRSGCLLERLLVRNLFVNGGQLLICREAIEAAGLFHPDLSFGEDWEYWTRLATLGEFVSLRRRSPVLFAREREDSAYRRLATAPQQAEAVLRTIHANPELRGRFGGTMLDVLRRKAEAEAAWIIGRERIRHGERREGHRWLRQSVRRAFSPKRAMLLVLAPLRMGPFRPYRFGNPPPSAWMRAKRLATILP
ncbi:MAG TPA: glycosyltransferase family A protein [Rhodopila sp.]|uniref:glycosyltransferase family 2 protein n=1 Tax=Rhodopila sp. TaxID=2480087 RepID=UPI002BCEA991|nr:glycosyltransferase family A protein [Rhodopila sp.]HVY15538.1 glycosyltransferase family A protein [Rhodopila sp.]